MRLSREQRNDLRVALENRYNTLLDEVRADRAKAGLAGERLSAAQADPGEHASALEATGLADAELGRDWRELEAIQQALARMDGGEYGTCMDCGKAIPLHRLKAFPAAVRCLDCQQAVERSL